MNKLPRRRATLICLVALWSAACASPTTTTTTPTTTTTTPTTTTATPTATPPETTPAAAVIGVSVDAHGAITAPAALSSRGYVFRVSSAAPAMVTLLKPKGSYTKAQLVADLGPHSDEATTIAAANRFDTAVMASGGAWSAAGESGLFAAALGSGTYWVVDLAREPLVANVHTLTVTGSPLATNLPQPDAVASATSERTWTVPRNLPAKGTLLLRNSTLGTHQFVIEPVPPSLTPAAYLSATRTGRGMEAPWTIPGPSLVSAGVEFLWTFDLPPGSYVVMDLSLGSYGYRQYAGAGAILVSLS